MAYWLHLKTLEPCTGVHHTSAQEANDGIDRATHKVTFIATDDEMAEWRQREEDRFRTGFYVRTPWHYSSTPTGVYEMHYAHLSLTHPGMIAYTETEEKGFNDKQTITRPGRYLDKFYKDRFDSSERDSYIAQCSAEHLTLHVARTPADIETVYLHAHASSCMDRHHFPDMDVDTHPSRVYGNSDLAVAYYGDIDDAHARCVVWPDRMRYSRIYGNVQVMQTLLDTAGYTEGSMRGARIRAIETGNGYLMPYVDGISQGSLCGDNDQWIILDNRGHIDTQVTNGCTAEEEMSRCEHCNDSYSSSDEDSGDGLCGSCYQDCTSCEECNTRIFCNDGNYNNIQDARGNSQTVCDDCYSNLTRTCACEDCNQSWVEESLEPEDQRERIALHVSDVCEDCASRFRLCYACDTAVCDDEILTPDVCPHCGHTLRCAHTSALPLDGMAIVDPVLLLKIARVDAIRQGVRSFWDGETCRDYRSNAGILMRAIHHISGVCNLEDRERCR